VFGEGGLFTQELGHFRRESAEAMSWLSVYVLTASALQEISAEYPEVPPPFHHGLDAVG
jgi:CRP-like cAMP-binding protein